ncbi:hypothetical protein WJ0W_000216 [Paenibacillus melissococcoides]|uniref:Uncharacterized protein n=1 Tax=Paenibacillus melissococcoides TaxID=2912268 RepID=A0ABN8U0H9_9BACL|nr:MULTISPECIES: hypothetical protein [Paenibacillus]MEB9895994.1 hypothetical protein [Bacillus cereus]CAH8243007.1 hypothetical protein WJ0W_000216 [Paenibacillus melissococcoides]CAH8703570.1 hypothetical protein WDD9_000213 [Paenibacillus melissococcoides]CAH8706517.1 hypothetical protein HTL2_001297 [Paenibacillus melissococcoides]GIO79055.1 hypothetical protein J6TS7_26650 [Paenibacillus dendritiformis]
MIVEVRFGYERTPGTLYLDCRDDVALQIKKLQNEFDRWCMNLSDDHPIKEYREELVDGKVINSYYVICIGNEDFPNWINEKYGEEVVKIVKQPEEDPPIILYF